MTHDRYPSRLALWMLLWRQLHSLLRFLTLFQCFLALTHLACLVLWSSASCCLLLSDILVRSTKIESLPALALRSPRSKIGWILHTWAMLPLFLFGDASNRPHLVSDERLPSVLLSSYPSQCYKRI